MRHAILCLALSCALGCTSVGADDDASVGTDAADPPDPADAGPRDTGPRVDTGPLPTADFEARCAAPGVVRCVGFDDPADIEGGFGDVHGILPGATRPELDTAIRASGASSLHFTLPARAGADAAGSYFTNFSDDLSVQFDGGDELYVQWRQRFSPEMITTDFPGGGGWKQVIIGTGDFVGCSAGSAISLGSGGRCASSCSSLETVVQNSYQRGFPILYNSCTGSASHGPYTPLEEPFGAFDFRLQNARPDPYCLYSQSSTSYFPPEGNCLGYSPDEWMTFQVGIRLGARTGDEFVGSHLWLWVAREGQPSEAAIDWESFNLTAGDPAVGERFGKVWLLPYNTGRDDTVDNPVTHTWYDELIVSRSRIADPE